MIVCFDPSLNDIRSTSRTVIVLACFGVLEEEVAGALSGVVKRSTVRIGISARWRSTSKDVQVLYGLLR